MKHFPVPVTQTGDRQWQINLTNLPSGQYLLSIANERLAASQLVLKF